jgi:Tfp pilus assembly protein PilO
MKINPQILIERFNGLDLKIRYAVFAAVLVFIAGLDYLLIMRVQLDGLNKIGAEIKTLSNDTARIKVDRQRINDIKNGLESQRSQLQALNSKIRSMQEIPTVLADISRTANDSGVNINQLVPSNEGQEVLITADDGKYYAVPIVIEAHSAYHMFGRFLNTLESGNLLFMVRDLRMEGNEKDAGRLHIQATLKMVLVDHTPEIIKK